MQKTEYMEFRKVWNDYRMIFSHQPLSDDATLMVFEMFDGVNIGQVIYGMKAALKAKNQMPAVADVLEQIRKAQGQGTEQTKHAAETAFQALNKTAALNGSVYDWIIEDPKLCAVVKRLWGTPQGFARMCNGNSRDYSLLQRNFVNAWLETSEAEIKDPRLPHVFLGSYPDRERPCVLFCGEYKACEAIGNRYYKELMHLHPRYPQRPDYWTPEKRAEQRALMEKREDLKTEQRIGIHHYNINDVAMTLDYLNALCGYKGSQALSKVSDHIRTLYVRQHNY